MLRRVIKRSRFVCVGAALLQHDQKKEPGSAAENVKTKQSLSSSGGETVKVEIKDTEQLSKTPQTDDGISRTYKQVSETTQSEISGWDRIKNLFKKSEYEEPNPNLTFISDMAQYGLVLGFLVGGQREYLKAFNLFILTNDTTKFLNAADAKRQLARVGMQAFLKGGFFAAPKVGFLIGLFMLVETIVSEYRGKNGIMEFPIAGAVTTAAMKWNLGIRGMISGCVTGGLAGLLLGPSLYFILKLNGITVTDTKYMLYSLKKKRESIVQKSRPPVEGSEWQTLYLEKTKHLPPGFTDKL